MFSILHLRSQSGPKKLGSFQEEDDLPSSPYSEGEYSLKKKMKDKDKKKVRLIFSVQNSYLVFKSYL